MKTKAKSDENRKTFVEIQLPDELRLVSAIQVRQAWPISEAQLWRADKSGELPALRYGKRRFYKLTDLKAFLNRAQRQPAIPVPWAIKPTI